MMNADQAGIGDRIRFSSNIATGFFGELGMYRSYSVGNGVERISHFMGDAAAQAFQKRYL